MIDELEGFDGAPCTEGGFAYCGYINTDLPHCDYSWCCASVLEYRWCLYFCVLTIFCESMLMCVLLANLVKSDGVDGQDARCHLSLELDGWVDLPLSMTQNSELWNRLRSLTERILNSKLARK
jgi:hypothetical protein